MKKKTNDNGLLIFGALAAVGAGVYAFMQEKKATGTVIPTGSSSVTPTPSPSIIPMPVFPLKKGSVGKEVKAIQDTLLKLGGLAAMLIKQSGGADSKFGPGTEQALQAAGFPMVIDEAWYKKIVSTAVQPAAVSSTGTKGVVDSMFSAPIYQSVKKGLLDYTGDKVITHLSDNTAVGRFVQQLGSMILFETTIDNKIYRFWMNKGDVELMTAALFDQKFSAFQINDKTATQKRTIVAFFA